MSVGPRLRTDVVDVYVFRRTPEVELLQLRRAAEPFAGAWHPIMGHVEPGETAVQTAARELGEEVGLAAGTAAVLGAWQLEQTHPFFLADRDEIVLSPRFVVEAEAGFQPLLNDEHDAHRWIPIAEAPRAFIWPGQRHAIRELAETVLPGGDSAAALSLLGAAGAFARPQA
ncbi:MAG: NUDIX domain-containing protein [Planctomycetota bacterium]